MSTVGNHTPTALRQGPIYRDNTSQSFAHYVFSVAIPALSCTGLFGNWLGILILQRSKTLRKLPSISYLTALAVASTLFLAVTLLQFLDPKVGYVIYRNNAVGCKLLTFLHHSADMFAAWLIATLCADRLLVLYFPNATKRLRSVTTARITCVLLAGIMGLLNGWILLLLSPRATSLRVVKDASSPIYKVCGVSTESKPTASLLNGISTILGIIAPLLITFAGTAIIIGQLYRYRQYYVKKDETTVAYSTSQADSSPETVRFVPESPSGRDRQLMFENLETTRRLLFSCALFLVLETPMYFEKSVSSFFTGYLDQRIYCVIYLMYYTYHACLSFVYIFASKLIRKEARKLFDFLFKGPCVFCKLLTKSSRSLNLS